MSIIEEIKQDYEDFMPHDDDCLTHVAPPKKAGATVEAYGAALNRLGIKCNCTRRDKIAWLERLKEPTDSMYDAGLTAATQHEDSIDVGEGYKAMLKAAEENLP